MGDAICVCLIPIALGLAVGAMLAGSKAQKPSQTPVSAVAAASPEITPVPAPSDIPEPTPEPTTTPAPAADAIYYRQPGEPAEIIAIDAENGRWSYRSDDLGIDIARVSTKDGAGKPVVYFVADIHIRDISQFRPGFGAEAHTGRGAIYPWIIARREKAVLWITGDNLINDEREEKGILIRDGRLFWSANAEDTLAIYPDMTMRIVKKRTMAPLALLEDGVESRWELYRERNRFLREAFRGMGLSFLAETGRQSATLTIVKVPEYITYAELYDRMKGYGFIIYGCKGILTDKYFQIANMGDLSDEMLQSFVNTLQFVLYRARREAGLAVDMVEEPKVVDAVR
jgi:hypothetical protein